MKKIVDKHENDVIDLGAAIVETRGAVQGIPDSFGLPQKAAGISDD